MSQEEEEKLEEAMSSLKYFWDEKGDIERSSMFKDNYDLIKREHPEILIAWENYKNSRMIFTVLLSQY